MVKLLNFCTANKLKIEGSLFRHKNIHECTWCTVLSETEWEHVWSEKSVFWQAHVGASTQLRLNTGHRVFFQNPGPNCVCMCQYSNWDLAGMALIPIADWTCGCAGKTVTALENTCHTWVLLRWWFTKKRDIKCTYIYLDSGISQSLTIRTSKITSNTTANVLSGSMPTLKHWLYRHALQILRVLDVIMHRPPCAHSYFKQSRSFTLRRKKPCMQNSSGHSVLVQI